MTLAQLREKLKADRAKLADLRSKATADGAPPEDGVFVVGVTGGGASALTAPWDARP